MGCNAIWHYEVICLRIPISLLTVYTWYSSEIHREFMTNGGLARSVYRHERSPRAQTIMFTSHYPQHRRSPRAQLILNLISMRVHNIISIKGMMMHLNQSNINIIHNHLNYHNYTGVIKKTQSHKNFKSIIYQLMFICFDILKLQSTFYSSNFPFYNTDTRTNARQTINIRPPIFRPYLFVNFFFIIFN